MPLRTTTVVIAALLIGSHVACAQAGTSVRGQARTCRDFADLDYALAHPGSLYFRDWTSKDFADAAAWVADCASAPPTKYEVNRRDLLAQRRKQAESSGDIQHAEASLNDVRAAEIEEQREKDAQRAASEAEFRAAQAVAAAKQAQREQCTRSPAYERFVAAVNVQYALDRQSSAQQVLDREKRIEDASGTVDLYAKRDAGEALIAAQDEVRRWWSAYRQAGGNAPSPQTIPRPIEDPCR